MPARDALSTVFAALADPTRRAILTHLQQGPSTAGEVAAPFAMSRSAVSQHLRVLEDAGLIERTVTAQWRTCVLRTEPLDEVASWVDSHRRLWDERFDLLDQRLQRPHDTQGESEMTETDQKTFTITRVFDAPRSAVWQAWTDPDEAAAWWHPDGLVTPRDTVDLDVRPGGSYRYTMVAPDGGTYPTGGVYREVVEPERLVFTWADPGDPQDVAPVITVTLEDLGAQTRMTFRLDGHGGQPGDDGVYDGWDSAFDVLGEHLA